MIEQDTVRLLRECDAGVKMGLASMDEVMEHVRDQKLRQCLANSRDKHEALNSEIQTLLDRCNDEGKEPNPVAKGMGWVKTNLKLGMDDSDQTIADLMTDGCNMGIKSLRKYLNQYEAADEASKDLAKRLINLEEKLVQDVRAYL